MEQDIPEKQQQQQQQQQQHILMVNCLLTRVLRPFKTKRTVFPINCAGNNWIAVCKQIKLDPYLIPSSRNNSKCIIVLDLRPKAIKLRRKHRGKFS